MLAFANDDIIRVVSQNFVPVAANEADKRARIRTSEVDFFRRIVTQHWDGISNEGRFRGETTQGVYIMTADGELLKYSHDYRSPPVFQQHIQEAIEKWNRLPASRRRPGAVQIKAPSVVGRPPAKPPVNGLIFFVSTRKLHRNPDGTYRRARIINPLTSSSRNGLWLNEKEWKSLIPKTLRVDAETRMDAAVLRKIARFNLKDHTQSLGKNWRSEDIREAVGTIRVVKADSRNVRLRMNGHVLLSTHAELSEATKSYDAQLGAIIDYNPRSQSITRCDMVSVGQYYADSYKTPGKKGKLRSGDIGLGVSFELWSGDPQRKVLYPISGLPRDYYSQ